MYADLTDLVARYGAQELIDLTDRADEGVVDEVQTDLALADATAEINGYIAARYKLPLSQTVPDLVRIASDIARYRLYDDQATDEVRRRYEQALDFLRLLASGKASLVGTEGLVVDSSAIYAPVRALDFDDAAEVRYDRTHGLYG